MPERQPVRVGVLGPLQVRVGGREVGVGGKVPRVLLSRLVLARGATVSSAELVEDVWGEQALDAGGTSLHPTISRLRRVLEPDRSGAPSVLVRLGPGYALHLPPGAVDAAAFDEAARRGRELLAAGDPTAAAAALDAALALWRGDAHADCAGHAFAAAEAHRLTELRDAAAELRLAAGLDLDDLDATGAGLEAFTAAHPLRERAWELLALTRYRQGRRADALAALAALRERLADELGADPGPGAARLQAAILAQDPALLPEGRRRPERPTSGPPRPRQEQAPAPGAAPSDNLPVALSSFIGREGEVSQVQDLLARHRLVTLAGTGGLGKTTLALHAARARDDDDGPWLVELAGVQEPGLLVEAVSTALRLTPAGGVAGLAAVLRERRALLVLDNCEHLVDAVAELVGPLLAQCPGLRVLATSREALDVEGEHVHQVSPLTGGDHGAAVQLFLDRARAAGLDREPTGEELALLTAVCDDLDGLPLAIELAAAQARLLSLRQISELLDDRFTLLRGGRRANTRHATMLAAVQWSYERLEPAEREVFEALAVFEGTFPLDGARAVSGRRDVVAVLASLVAKSMVVVVGGDPRRYRVLETLRQYAERQCDPERRAEHGRRLVAWVADIATGIDPMLRSHMSVASTDRLHEESANIRAALRLADPATVLRIASGFYWFWFREGLVSEGLGHLAPALAHWDEGPGADLPDGPDHATRCRAALGVALLTYLTGDIAGVAAALATAGRHAALTDDRAATTQALSTVSYFEARSGQVGPAREHAMTALALAEAIGHRTARAEVLMVLGYVEHHDGHPDEAVDRLEAAVAEGTAAGYAWVTVSSLWNLTKVHLAEDRLDDAETALLRALDLTWTAGETTSWLVVIATLSHLRHRLGRPEEAAELAGAVAWMGGRIGFSPASMDPDLERYAEALVADLAPEEFAVAAARGHGMSADEITRRARELLVPAG